MQAISDKLVHTKLNNVWSEISCSHWNMFATEGWPLFALIFVRRINFMF